MPLPPQKLPVAHSSDVGAARRAAKALARDLGFSSAACEEVALAVTELATNLLRHAGGGELVFVPLAAADRVGLQVESHDQGAGIPDVDRALTDGFSTAGSRGVGLGAVNRLMDGVEIVSRRGTGTHVVCRKWLRDYPASIRSCPLTIGAATRAWRNGSVNGDAFLIRHWNESALVGLIDGLGHGQFAHRAAQTARQYAESHFDLPLEQIFRGAGRACRATRGVVMALARFDWGLSKVTYASVGNIEARALSASGPVRFMVRRGIVGLNARNPAITEHPWPPANLLVLHTDGVRTHWTWKDFPNLQERSATDAARSLLYNLAKTEDDATVLVVRSAIPCHPQTHSTDS